MKAAWERDDVAFIFVLPVMRRSTPSRRHAIASSNVAIDRRATPTSFDAPLRPSRMHAFGAADASPPPSRKRSRMSRL